MTLISGKLFSTLVKVLLLVRYSSLVSRCNMANRSRAQALEVDVPMFALYNSNTVFQERDVEGMGFMGPASNERFWCTYCLDIIFRDRKCMVYQSKEIN